MTDYNQNQIRTFNTFLGFVITCLITLIVSMTLTSQIYRVDEISYNSNKDFDFTSHKKVYGKSIWLVSENAFDDTYGDNPDIKKLFIQKDIPNSRLVITVEVYEQIAYLVDKRSSITNIKILLENNYMESSNDLKFPISSVEILNGPVGEGFNGELISFFKTLDKYEYTKTDFTLEYDGKQLVGFYNRGIYELGLAVDLGRKGSVLGTYLEDDFCDGTVRFISSDSTIENCK